MFRMEMESDGGGLEVEKDGFARAEGNPTLELRAQELEC